MKVIKPAPLGAAQLVSSNVPETDYGAWSNATNYAVGERVIADHVIYESVQTPNTNNAPATTPLYWAKVGPTNRWAMFDTEISTLTEVAGNIEVVVKPGYVTSLAMFGLQGSTASVSVRDGVAGPVVFSQSKPLDGSIVLDWFQYFFEPIDQLEEIIFDGMPPYSNAHITVTVSGTATKCGILAVGTVYDIGRAQRGASAGIIDYSRKDTSATGVTTFAKRRFSKRMSAQVVVANASLNKLQRVLAGLRAAPCVWIGTDAPGYQPLTVFGFYRDFSIDIAYATTSYCNLEIEGLT